VAEKYEPGQVIGHYSAELTRTRSKKQEGLLFVPEGDLAVGGDNPKLETDELKLDVVVVDAQTFCQMLTMRC
jgi:hypothetical protein